MANYEGKGPCAPVRLPVSLGHEEMVSLYKIAQYLDRYERRSDKWGKGLRESLELPTVGILTPSQRAIFVGKIGEYAFTVLAQRRPFGSMVPGVDIVRRLTGDGGIDVLILGLHIQVKTRQREFGSNLIKRVDELGNMVRLEGDAHLFCEWLPPANRVHVLGWLWNREIKELPVVPSPVGKWLNINVPAAKLLPLKRLWLELESRLVLGAA